MTPRVTDLNLRIGRLERKLAKRLRRVEKTRTKLDQLRAQQEQPISAALAHA